MSGSKKVFTTADASRSCHGLMVCSSCSKPITQGLYLVRDAGNRFVTHHQHCAQAWKSAKPAPKGDSNG